MKKVIFTFEVECSDEDFRECRKFSSYALDPACIKIDDEEFIPEPNQDYWQDYGQFSPYLWKRTEHKLCPSFSDEIASVTSCGSKD